MKNLNRYTASFKLIGEPVTSFHVFAKTEESAYDIARNVAEQEEIVYDELEILL